MIKLFVDDIRREWDGWHKANTITDAIRILATVEVEIVSLDHDIQQSIPGTRGFETFEPVARYIALMPNRPEVQFHTGNPYGGKRMADILGLDYSQTRVEYCKVESWRGIATDTDISDEAIECDWEEDE